MAIKIVISGSRTFNNYIEFFKACDKIFSLIEHNSPLIIIDGGAMGTDRMAGKYARIHHYTHVTRSADWTNIKGKVSSQIRTGKKGNKYWILAGFKRNQEMAKEGDILIAFWDMRSKGTQNMIKEARIQNMDMFIFNINKL